MIFCRPNITIAYIICGMDQKNSEVIVHYSRGEPFRSITSVHSDDFDSVLKTLNEDNAWGLTRFSDARYLEQRFAVEERVRGQFIAMGGKPILQNPIYFFLGRNRRFEENHKNLGYMISLQDIDPLTISFSYGDSMFCFDYENKRLAGEKYENILCDKLYLLESLSQLISHPNFPSKEPLNIEAHLWVTPNPLIVKRLER